MAGRARSMNDDDCNDGARHRTHELTQDDDDKFSLRLARALLAHRRRRQPQPPTSTTKQPSCVRASINIRPVRGNNEPLPTEASALEAADRCLSGE